jgi:hypothetical protein
MAAPRSLMPSKARQESCLHGPMEGLPGHQSLDHHKLLLDL